MFKVRGRGGGSVEFGILRLLAAGASLDKTFFQGLPMLFTGPRMCPDLHPSAPLTFRTLLTSASEHNWSILREADTFQSRPTSPHRRIKFTPLFQSRLLLSPSPQGSTPTSVSKLDRHRVRWREESVGFQSAPFNL